MSPLLRFCQVVKLYIMFSMFSAHQPSAHEQCGKRLGGTATDLPRRHLKCRSAGGFVGVYGPSLLLGRQKTHGRENTGKYNFLSEVSAESWLYGENWTFTFKCPARKKSVEY